MFALLDGLPNGRDATVGTFGVVPVPPRDLTGNAQPKPKRFIQFVQSRRELRQGVADNTLRIQGLQEQMREMTGRVETLLFEIQRLQQQIQLMQEESEFRAQEEAGDDQRSDAVSPSGNETNTANLNAQEDDEHAQGGNDADLLAVDDTTVSATNRSDPGVEKPLDLGAAIRIEGRSDGAADIVGESQDPLLKRDGIASLGTLNLNLNGDPEALYNQGYTQLLNGEYDASEVSLRQFIELYSNHQLAANARYWLGETYFIRGQFGDAVAEFSENYRTFPNSNKAPDSLLKLGLSLARLDEREAACATLTEMLSRFPDSSRSIRIAAHEEQARSNCS